MLEMHFCLGKNREILLMKMKNLYGKNILVTGASSGIGKACALRFAQSGCHVIGVAINCEERMQYFENGGCLELHNMDVTKEDEVERLVARIQCVDIAVLCAGIGVAGPVEELSIDLAKKQMDVNYFGTLRVCQAVLPKMREKRKGLVIVISSVAGRVPIPMQSHYSSSKYALEAMVECIRMEMRQFNVRAALIEPGDTHTGFTESRQFYDNTDSVYKEMCATSVEKMEKDERNGRSPDSVAKIVVKLAGRKHPPVRSVVGAEYRLLMFLLRFLPDTLTEAILSKLYLT